MLDPGSSGLVGPDVLIGLEVLADRCVHGRMAVASCRACVQACPKGAWTLDEDGLQLARAACDQCGLCLPVCPRQAIRWLPGQSWSLARRPFAGAEAILAGCDQAGLDPEADSGGDDYLQAVGEGKWADYTARVSGAGGDNGVGTRSEQPEGLPGRVACLHGIGLHDLLGAYQQGVRVWLVASGPCKACPRGGGEHFSDLVAHLNKALGQRGQPSIVLREISPAAWRAVLSQSEAPSRRRAFFRQFARQPLAGLTGTQVAQAGTLAPGQADQPVGGLMPPGEDADLPWIVDLDPMACTACHVCARICPDQAIVLEVDQGAYRLDHAHCTGCGLCSDACASGAVAPRPWAAPRQRRVPLVSHICPLCGVAYAGTVAGEAGAMAASGEEKTGMCTVCASNQARKRLYQVMADG